MCELMYLSSVFHPMASLDLSDNKVYFLLSLLILLGPKGPYLKTYLTISFAVMIYWF